MSNFHIILPEDSDLDLTYPWLDNLQPPGIYNMSTTAMHDSSARDPPPRCRPGTRRSTLNKILTFVEDPEPNDSEVVLWMHAPAGYGKTAIMQSVIETLVASGRRHYIAGGFFFGRDVLVEGVGRDKAHNLLPTILYQATKNIPGMEERVRKAIVANERALLQPIDGQACLLVDSFEHYVPQSKHTPTPTIFIDGLDECDTPAAQYAVLGVIQDVVLRRLPLRFVIASRFEYHLHQRFTLAPLCPVTRSFELSRNYYSEVYYAKLKYRRWRAGSSQESKPSNTKKGQKSTDIGIVWL
ncbi:hypothetical protein CPB83DRAFT_864493 [Crepidotus variabilis]|uniref:Nephrocystin 3-like N-terminal domain-containing protein n=1 Tax=Crepidotus variabilis TaxID=179855 RepID=A0A9P6E4J6_9AGAR|nr:hypothetical protein CPB83DRAFT_864493 [Crepidotus variabilis]